MMQKDQILQNAQFTKVALYLNSFDIAPLRVIGREIGVSRASSRKKGDLISEIIALTTGMKEPEPLSRRGAPAKQVESDPAIKAELEKLSLLASQAFEEENLFAVNRVNEESVFEREGTVLFDCLGGGYFWEEETLPREERVLLSRETVQQYSLREGDKVVYTAEKTQGETTLVKLSSALEVPIGEEREEESFDTLSSQFPCEALLSKGSLLPFPVGKGQRALLLGNRERAYGFFREAIGEISSHSPQTKIFVLTVDGLIEEADELKNSLFPQEVFIRGLNCSPESKKDAVTALVERAKRLAERGEDSVVFLSSLSALAYAAHLTEGEGEHAREELSGETITYLRKIFSAGKSLKRGGSLTLFAHISEEERFAKQILSALSGTENCKISLNERGEVGKNSFVLHPEKIR